MLNKKKFAWGKGRIFPAIYSLYCCMQPVLPGLQQHLAAKTYLLLADGARQVTEFFTEFSRKCNLKQITIFIWIIAEFHFL
jgi:hypothetical protein